MKRTILLIFCFLNSMAYAEQVDSWFHPLPKNMDGTDETVPISDERFFEVSASKEATAEYWLTEKSFIPQTQDDIEFFGQRSFQCPSSTKPYLVRAVYENGGTGRYYVERSGSALLISHMSLGHASEMHRSALIVCLELKPTEIYHDIGGAL